MKVCGNQQLEYFSNHTWARKMPCIVKDSFTRQKWNPFSKPFSSLSRGWRPQVLRSPSAASYHHLYQWAPLMHKNGTDSTSLPFTADQMYANSQAHAFTRGIYRRRSLRLAVATYKSVNVRKNKTISLGNSIRHETLLRLTPSVFRYPLRFAENTRPPHPYAAVFVLWTTKQRGREPLAFN